MAGDRRGFAAQGGSFFAQLTEDLAGLIDVPTPAGYSFRSVTPGEAESRAACHRAAWSDVAPSAVSGWRYERLMRTAPYRHELDWVAYGDRGGLVRPRGDDGYPGPVRLYRSIVFRPTTRTLTLVGPGSPAGPKIAP